MSVPVPQASGIYGEYNVPFNGSDGWPANSSIVLTENHWWIPQFEIPFLIIVIILGLVGNISIIGAILLEKKLKFAGNAFIVNLAVADLVITSYILPGVLANVITNRNLFPPALCSFTAVVLSVSCIGSMYSLMFVAINRYVAIVRNLHYTTSFSNKKILWMIVGIWVWSLLLTIPPAFGWGDYRYHKKIHVCMYDCNAEKYLTFTVSYVCLSIILPFLVTCFCYRGVFVSFKKNRFNVKNISEANTTTVSCTITNTKLSAELEDRERRLVITLLTTVSLFMLCWMPYALIILINHKAPGFFKRSAAWLAFSNSSMNSILYGLLNQNFRNGYKKLWGDLLFCESFRNLIQKLRKVWSVKKTGNNILSGGSKSKYVNRLYNETNFNIVSNTSQSPVKKNKTEVEIV